MHPVIMLILATELATVPAPAVSPSPPDSPPVPVSQELPPVPAESTYVCSSHVEGERITITSVRHEGDKLVVRGNGFRDAMPFLLMVDNDVVNGPEIQDTKVSFPLDRYPGRKLLPATTVVAFRSDRSGEVDRLISNRCNVEFPGLWPIWIGGASALTVGRGGQPGAMTVAFVGWPGSAQALPPHSKCSTKADGSIECKRLTWGAKAMRVPQLVVGGAKVGDLPFAFTIGLGASLGEFRVLYAVRLKEGDAPRHMLGVAGAFNVHALARKVSGGGTQEANAR